MPGRKKKPSALKIVHGTMKPKKSKKKVASKPPPKSKNKSKIPGPPSYLTRRQKFMYRKFIDQMDSIGLLTGDDTDAIVGLSKYWVQWETATKILDDKGLTFESESRQGAIMIRKRPEISIANESWKMVMRILTEYGLTPCSREKVTPVPKGTSGKGKEDWDDL